MDPVMYVLINSDLKMREGKIAAQVGHVVHMITDKIIHDIYETIPVPEYCLQYIQWCKKPTLIILRASEPQLNEIT